MCTNYCACITGVLVISDSTTKYLSLMSSEYDFDLLFDVDVLEAGIKEFKKLIESFEEIHVRINEKMKKWTIMSENY